MAKTVVSILFWFFCLEQNLLNQEKLISMFTFFVLGGYSAEIRWRILVRYTAINTYFDNK